MRENKQPTEGQFGVGIDEIEKAIENELAELRELPDDVKKEKNEDVIRMIEYYGNMTDNVETRRVQLHQATLYTIMLCLTLIGLIYTQRSHFGLAMFWAIVAGLLSLIVFSLCLSFVFQKQSGYRYPFLKLDRYGNTWKWFYYGCSEILKIDRNALWPSQDPEDTIYPYLRAFRDLIKNYREEDIDAELGNNLRQMHLLRVHNYYKNKFYLQLSRIREISLLAFLCVILVVLLLFWVCEALTAPSSAP